MIRTLWVTNDFPPRPGGIEQFLANLVAGRPPGSASVLAASWNGDHLYDAGVPYPVARVGRRPLLPTRQLARAVNAAAEAADADVVVLGALWPLGGLSAEVQRPVVALTHGHEAGMARVGLGPLVRRTAGSVCAVGYISEYTRQSLRRWLPDRSLVHVPPGVDTEAFSPQLDGSSIRRRHGIADDARLVVCISRLVRRKGQDVLVEAWPAVRARLPDAHLLLAGAGPLEAPLQRRIAALDLEQSVTLAGAVPWAELPRYHAAADLFAMPCRTRALGLDAEGLGIVYLEAQASGKPVLAGRSGGAPEAVQDGTTGLVVDGGSVAEVAHALTALLRDGARRREMGCAGREAMVQRHAWKEIGRRLDDLLSAGLAGPGAVP